MNKNLIEKFAIAIFFIFLIIDLFWDISQHWRILDYAIAVAALLNAAIALNEGRKYLVRKQAMAKLNQRIIEINNGIREETLEDFANKGFPEDAARQIIVGIYLSHKTEDADLLSSSISNRDPEELFKIISAAIKDNKHGQQGTIIDDNNHFN
ncbi:hypothetical protein FD723_40250 (plasmid) [Nostoc sp. C052]|uniref:hypothetical protein n=1 Tax=Nostoc sp. C052 TaxID=2576902 RepID=UPI0015C2E2A7|nr:hypothetical protein [Nostoc sp. C052]QLE46446.1 hypothetical protein FD723_40250 [Nostoc sp. C052]